MDVPDSSDSTISQPTSTSPAPSKGKLALLIASGALSAFVLFSMLTVPSFYAGLFRGGTARTMALSNLLRLVGANTQQPLTGPISGPITETPTPSVFVTITPSATSTISPTLPQAQIINFNFWRILYRDGQGMLSWNDQSVLRYDCQDLVGNSTSGVVSLNVQQSNSITVPMRGQIYDCTYDEQLPQAPLGYMWLKSQISTYTENNNRNVTVVNRLVSVGGSATTITPTNPPPTPTSPPPTPTNTLTPTPTSILVKRVFVTSQRYNGYLGGLSGADLKCQQRADAANLGGTWKAWLSSSTQSATSRLTHFNGPYVLINGTTIANNWSDLIDGTIASPINVTELNGLVSIPVWTNTDINGEIAPNNKTWHCSNWTTSSSSRRGNTGETQSSNSRWTTGISELCSQNNYVGLYCFEQ